MASKSGTKSLAAIYAQALYEAAEQAQLLEQVSAELNDFSVMLQKLPKLERFLVSPVISFAEKRKVIDGALAGYSKIMRNFLLVLVERKRAAILAPILVEFTNFSNRKASKAEVQVHTAVALESSEREKLRGVLSGKLGKSISLTERVRPELLGGMVLIHEDKMWDASLQHSLKKLMGGMESLKLAQIKWSENGG